MYSKMAASIQARLWLLLVIIANSSGAKQKYVSVTLDAKWKSTPMLLEASEFVAKESQQKFWGYVDAVTDLSPGQIAGHHDQALYHLVQKFAGRFLSDMQVNLLKFSLSLRSYSPKVEMYNQIAKDYKDKVENCEAFVNVHGEITCSSNELQGLIDSASDRSKPFIFKFDHIYPESDSNDIVVILYAQLGTATFQNFHSMLTQLATKGPVKYILRHYVKDPPENNVRLSGYGVELAIKSTEYKAKDDTKVEEGEKSQKDDHVEDEEVQGFIFAKLKTLHPDYVDNLNEFRSHLVESSKELTTLKAWQMQDLSYQAAQRFLSAPTEDALKVLTDISQNFPVKTRSLVNVQVNNELKEEIQLNQKVLESYNVFPGESALFLNGLQVDLEVIDMFLLLDLMRNEAKLLDGLHAMGTQGEALSKIMSLNLKDNQESYALDIRDDSVQWLNDLENDAKYSNWPGSVQDLLRPTWPGMMRHVAKNFFHMVLFVNPADEKCIPIIKMAEAFLVHSAPVRIGLVFVTNGEEDVDYTEDASVALLRAFNYIENSNDATKALSFLTDVYETAADDEVSPELVIATFKKLYSSNVEGVFGEESQYDTKRIESVDYYVRTGLGDLPQALMNGVPMSKSKLNMDDFEEAALSEIMRATPNMQRDVYNGFINEHTDLLDYAMNKDNVLPRLNARVLATKSDYLDFSEPTSANETLDSPPDPHLTNEEMAAILASNMKYLTKKDVPDITAASIWVVCDLETEAGRALLYDAIKHTRSSSDVRLGIVHNPTTLVEDSDAYFISQAVQSAMETLTGNIARNFVTKLLKEENIAALADKTKTLADLEVNGMDMEAYLKVLEKQTTSFLNWGKTFSEKVLGFRRGARGVIANGRILGPFRPDEAFISEDFGLLDKYTIKISAGKISPVIKSSLNLSANQGSQLIMQVAALLESQTSDGGQRRQLNLHGEKHSVLVLPGNPNQPAYDIIAIMDPLTRAAQKLSPLLMVLREVANMNIKIIMNCKDKLSELPLKNFYKLVLEPEPQFKVDSSISSGPSSRFIDLPQKALLTLNVDPPESWMIETVRTPYDLDNIYLEEVDNGINAEHELEHLLLEGHCFDMLSGQPPRGLQFTLGTYSTPVMVDTIVMANLGYFQLKANPGSWLLNLRHGRSADIYDIASHELTESEDNETPVTVVIDSFRGKTIKIKVNKKPDMKTEDLLAEDDKKSMWDSLSSKLTGGEAEDKDETLNIFSLASGHLYERFLRIMMLSVLKNTKSKVKFWFLKNYLSPTFKDFIPHMAKEYGFEYELVQYKWPHWLHQQTEKQRIIWGYKILFFDVLFPLDVKKIIFVDADLTVFVDLQELYDLDLGGAPYGYTPFCESKSEMDGYRFWKSGYWSSHLAGRKYHISALYVVDLKKFRKIAAGDRLRGQYQGLSQDPNSLSNLDQDLPNNMIHQVAIKSLPQEWLWCETWCDDASKAKAKTIDLCNNPETKEPKLKAAVRIVPEWTGYDNEIKKFWAKIYKNSTKDAEDSSNQQSQDSNGNKHEEL